MSPDPLHLQLPVRAEPRPPYPDRAFYPERQYADSPQSDSPEQGGLLEYWRILVRRKGTLIIIAFVGAVIGFLVTLPQTPIYQAHTSVEIVGVNDSFLNMKQVNPLNQTGASSETSDIQTQIKILQSESLIERVLNKLKKPEKYTETGGRISAWRKALNLTEAKPGDAFATSIAYATKNLKVRAAGQTRILEITVDSTDPQSAASFANTLANEFIDENLESRWKTTERTTEWLTRQLDDVRIKLERSDDKLQEYARNAGLLFTQDNKSNVDEDKLRQLQANLTAAQGDRIAKQSRYETAAISTPEALPDILSDEGLRDYGTKLTDLRRQIAELGSTYTPDHPKVQRVQAQLATVQAAFERDRGNILKRIKNDYDEALRKEKLLSDDYAQQTHLVSGEGEKAVQYNILKREVDSNRAVYDAMLQQLNQASIAAALRASNVRVVDPAKIPGRPYRPDSTQSAGIGLFSGLFLGIAFIVMRERADRTIQQPGDSTFYLNVPELGIIPAGSLDQRRRLKHAVGKAVITADVANRVELVTLQHKQSMLAESFRSTLVSILFSGENGSRPRTIVLTSPSPTEGKTTVVCNLGIAIAEVGNRVLIIDADLRRPRIHNIFGVEASPGLSDMLKDRTSATSEAAKEAIRPTAVPNLFVLASGESTSAAMTLLYGAQMPELLKQLRQQFDTILIDTPPMLQIPDARVLGRLSDRVILVVRAGKTTRDAAQAAFQRFQEDGTSVLGTILNDWNPKHAPSGYYGYYNGYYKGYKNYYSKVES